MLQPLPQLGPLSRLLLQLLLEPLLGLDRLLAQPTDLIIALLQGLDSRKRKGFSVCRDKDVAGNTETPVKQSYNNEEMLLPHYLFESADGLCLVIDDFGFDF